MGTVVRVVSVVSKVALLRWMLPPLSAQYLLRRSPWLVLGFMYCGTDCCWYALPCDLSSSTTGLTLAPFLNAHRASWSISVAVFRPNDASGSHPLGLHPWAGSQRPETVYGLRFGRGWKITAPDDCFDSLCFLDTQGKGTNMMHGISCRRGLCGQRRVPRGILVRRHYATDPVRKGFVAKLKLAAKEHGKGQNRTSSAG